MGDDATETAVPTKTELMDRVDRGWVALEAVIGRADEAQLTRPGEGGWSAKDHLAHLAAWERSVVALLDGTSRAAAAGVDEGVYEASGVEGENRQIHERTKDRPLADVLADLRQSHRQVLARLAALTDDDLRKPYSHFQPNDPPANPDPVVGWIAGDTYEHYEEHLATIRSLVEAT